MSLAMAAGAHAAEPQKLAVTSSSDGTNFNITVTGCDTTLPGTERATDLTYRSVLDADASQDVNSSLYGHVTKTGASYTISLPLAQVAHNNIQVACSYYQGDAQYALALAVGDGQLEGTVYTDVNENGTFDEGDTVIPNAPWTITDFSGKVIAEGTTDENGMLHTAALADGTYTLTVQSDNGPIVYTLTVHQGNITLTRGTGGPSTGMLPADPKDPAAPEATATPMAPAAPMGTTNGAQPGLSHTGEAASALPFAGIALLGAAAAGTALVSRKK